MSAYQVDLYDNFHVPETTPMLYAEFADYDSAVVTCRRLVDDSLTQAALGNPLITADDLLRQFAMFGDTPFITPAPEIGGFSAREYVAQRARELCARR